MLAYPLGGGFQVTIPAHDERRFRAVEPTEKQAGLFRSGNFTISDCDQFFRGWTDCQVWNGWEKPRFDRATCEAILKWIEGVKSQYDRGRDAFITISQDGEEEAWPVESITIVDGSEITVYGLGAGAWVWEKAKDWCFRDYIKSPDKRTQIRGIALFRHCFAALPL